MLAGHSCLHVRFPKLAQMWDQLPQTQRTRFKASIASLLSKENNIAVKINRPRLEHQNKWRWVIFNDAGRKAYIPKVYPKFSPVPGDTEPLKEAVPVWWRNPLMTLVITVFCLTVGMNIGLKEERQAVLYADSKWEGWYLLREITGLPELVDEEYPAVLKELEGIFGLTMPVLEELGGS